MDYKMMIKNHRKEIEALQEYFVNDPMSDFEDRIEKEFSLWK